MQFPVPVDDFRRRQAHERAVEHVSALLEDHLNAYGYERIETPLVQNTDLFLTKAGDQIITRLFTFERGGVELTLRPEFTAPAAQLYVSQFPSGGSVVRWQFHGHVFEDDAASPEHFERYTVGAERLGDGGSDADAEMIAMATLGLTQLGIDTWTLVIGHIGLLRAFLETYNLDSRTLRFLLSQMSALHHTDQGAAYVLAQLDDMLVGVPHPETDAESFAPDADPHMALNTQYILDVLLDATQRGSAMGSRTREDIARRLIEKRQRAAERPQIAAAVEFLTRYIAIDGTPDEVLSQIDRMIPPGNNTIRSILVEWRLLIDLLNVYGISSTRIRLRPALTRTWDYYTGVLFDLHTSDGTSLGGGGRYDELARLVGGHGDIPSVGFVYYADTLAGFVKAQPDSRRWRLAAMPNTPPAAGIAWAARLRQARAAVELLSDYDANADLIVHPEGTITYQTHIFDHDHASELIALLTGTPS